MALRNKDIKSLIVTVALSLGTFLLASDLQEVIKANLGITGSVVIGTLILIVTGFIFSL